MSDSIQPTSPITNYSYNKTYTSVIKNSNTGTFNNNYTVNKITYTITVYDVMGKLHTTSSNHTVSYTV